jgi:hypothetical protein
VPLMFCMAVIIPPPLQAYIDSFPSACLQLLAITISAPMYCIVQTLPCTQAMAPVVRVEPNGCQALHMFDGAYSNLEEFGWLPFIRRFDGFNPGVAWQFALTFNGC